GEPVFPTGAGLLVQGAPKAGRQPPLHNGKSFLPQGHPIPPDVFGKSSQRPAGQGSPQAPDGPAPRAIRRRFLAVSNTLCHKVLDTLWLPSYNRGHVLSRTPAAAARHQG